MTNEEDRKLADYCYECTGYGEDYFIDENGELVSACDECWVTQRRELDDE